MLPKISLRKHTTPRADTTSSEPQTPQWDTSNGYPKGIPEGPTTMAMVNGVRKPIHGIPWESLPEDIQKDLDERPLDDSGELRIFIKGSSIVSGGPRFIEFGSMKHAREFRAAIDDAARRLL